MSYDLLIGKTLRKRYKLLKLLGSGGFSDTYLAIDLDLPGCPKCVVKHLRPKDTHPTIVSIAKILFEREAQVLYRLSKKNHQIPKLFAHFEENREFYLVREFIDGHDLTAEIIAGKPLHENIVFQLLKDILENLAIIHQDNIIHRDIKPQNIIRQRDGKIVLIDFGAVKEVGAIDLSTIGKTGITVAVGTPGYMPNEQANGKPKLCSDVFAVGIIGIQALTGRRIPQDIDTDPKTGEIIWRQGTQVGNSFASVIDKMVRDHFSLRYQSATEALQDLISCRPSISLSFGSPVVPSHNQAWLPLNRVLAKQDMSISHSHLYDKSVIETVLLPKLKEHETPQSTAIGHPVDVRQHSIKQVQKENFVAITPENQAVVHSNEDKASKIYQLSKDQLIHTFSGYSSPLISIALSPNGQTLVSSHSDKTMKIWKLSTGKIIKTLVGHSQPVWSVAISPDSRILASGCGDTSIKIWKLSTGHLIRTLTWHGEYDYISSLALSPNGQTLVSSHSDNTIKIWKLSTGQLIRTLGWNHDSNHGSDHISSVAISQNGQTFISSHSNGAVKIWDLSTDQLVSILRLHLNTTRCVSISSDCQTLASGNTNGEIKIWDLSTGKLAHTLIGGFGTIKSFAISSTAQTLAVNNVTSIQIWNLSIPMPFC